jgi:hypothetical protein
MDETMGDAALWEAFVEAMAAVGPVDQRRSRYSDRPALFLNGREIAHVDGSGGIDLRVSSGGWSQLADEYAADPAIARDPARRDWIELRLRSRADLERLAGVLAVAVAANR